MSIIRLLFNLYEVSRDSIIPGIELSWLLLSISKSDDNIKVSWSSKMLFWSDITAAFFVKIPIEDPYPGVKIFSGFNSSTVISRFGIDISSSMVGYQIYNLKYRK